jgi:hypothetical protein
MDKAIDRGAGLSGESQEGGGPGAAEARCSEKEFTGWVSSDPKPYDPVGYLEGPVVRRGRRWRFPFPLVGVYEFFRVVGMTRTAISPYVCFANKRLAPKKFVSQSIQLGVKVVRIQ